MIRLSPVDGSGAPVSGLVRGGALCSYPTSGTRGEVVCLSDPTSGTRARSFLIEYMRELADRMRHVRVCCGDWSRVCGPSPTVKLGTTGVFLDPPYANEADRQEGLYSTDDLTVAHVVRQWAIENGDNPDLRIALCGYEGEHQMPDSWECVAWKARGGYGSQGDGRGRDNAGRERIWFSKSCLRPQENLFTARDLVPETPGSPVEQPLSPSAPDAHKGGKCLAE
jgi:hypothetical protein